MFNYELLPNLANQANSTSNINDQERNSNKNSSIQLFKLPPLIRNSTLIRQRLSSGAKDNTVASLLNSGVRDTLLADSVNASVSPPLQSNHNRTSRCTLESAKESPSSQPPNMSIQRVSPNMVSVVRPVPVSQTQSQQQQQFESEKQTTEGVNGQCSRLKTSKGGDLIDELMKYEENCIKSANSEIMNLKLLNLSGVSTKGTASWSHYENKLDSTDPLELDARRQTALLRREQLQLNGNVRKQHEFILSKLEQRKRGLRIVQAVWIQQDFKRAIERLVDLYNEGLTFQEADSVGRVKGFCSSQLSSLNSTLVSDVLAVIVLRPKLWSLDTCQLLLPIIINDFLTSHEITTSTQHINKKNHQDEQAELAMKALKLILTHFSPLIISTLQQTDQLGMRTVDLNREERFNRCSSCFKLLQEARIRLAHWRPTPGPAASRLLSLSRELEQLFNSALFQSGAIDGKQKTAHLSSMSSCQRRGH